MDCAPYKCEHVFRQVLIIDIIVVLACLIMPFANDGILKHFPLPFWFLS
jgi:hypothetical protein